MCSPKIKNYFGMASKEKQILNVGLACLDVVMICASYPKEDSDQRCVSHEWKRGGNASNNCSVMAQFQVPCEYFGTMSTDCGGKFLKENFDLYGICTANCIFYEDCSCPTSVVLINSINGSRTIVHSNKNLPELSIKDFKKLDLQKYKWIHFEARPSIDELKEMVGYIEEWKRQEGNSDLVVSIELEKAKQSYQELLTYADVVFISKDFANMFGYTTMTSAVEGLSEKMKFGSLLVCPWGENGACAKYKDGHLMVVPAYPPKKVIDTLGAGDTFIATTIFCLANNYDVEKALQYGCKVAGTKCGIEGIKGLGTLFPHLNMQNALKF